MATATKTTSQEDVKELIFSLEKLVPSYTGAKPLGSRSGSSSGGGHTPSFSSGSYSPSSFTLNCKQTSARIAAGGGFSYRVISEFTLPEGKLGDDMVPHINEGSEVNCDEVSEVNCEQTATYTTDVLSSKDRAIFNLLVFHDEGSKQRASYSPVTVSPMFRGPVPAEGFDGDERPWVCCALCSKEHPDYSYCPYVPCKVCYQLYHPSYDCPYLHFIPQGAAFDELNYEVVCCCGNRFNVEKWVCTLCPGRAQLMPKYCSICRDFKQHSNYECPEDEVRAALFKSLRDGVDVKSGL